MNKSIHVMQVEKTYRAVQTAPICLLVIINRLYPQSLSPASHWMYSIILYVRSDYSCGLKFISTDHKHFCLVEPSAIYRSEPLQYC